jgi:hypothetical protein
VELCGRGGLAVGVGRKMTQIGSLNNEMTIDILESSLQEKKIDE